MYSQMDSLLPMGEDVRKLVEEGKVYAVQDQQRSARLSLQDNHLHLHTLGSQPPPPGVHTITIEKAMEKWDPKNSKVFLDLAWGGTTRGRIYITLSPDTPAARQFVLLCTGERGPSFINTSFFKIWGRGRYFEGVYGGDYENNDGSGGTPLVQGLVEAQYIRSGGAGCVEWCGSDNYEASTIFSITTKQLPIVKNPRRGIFGQVTSGLELVQEAVSQNRSNIKNVVVVDCGVLLPML